MKRVTLPYKYYHSHYTVFGEQNFWSMYIKMKKKFCIGIIFCLSFSVIFADSDSTDYDWETRISNRIVEKARVTELFWVKKQGDTYLALFNKQNILKAKGAAIILHSIGGHADWPQTISPIRNTLPEHGWATLSIQLPLISPENNIEKYGETFKETERRIIAAVRLLREQGFFKIIIIGHGFGSLSSLVYLQKEHSQNVDAIVAISLQDYAYIKPPINILRLIEKIKIPVLDIYGSLDFEEGIESAPERRHASRKNGNRKYTQIEIKGADHYFYNMENTLIENIIAWANETILSDIIF